MRTLGLLVLAGGLAACAVQSDDPLLLELPDAAPDAAPDVARDAARDATADTATPRDAGADTGAGSDTGEAKEDVVVVVLDTPPPPEDAPAPPPDAGPPSRACAPCASHADCGAGGYCLRNREGELFCGAPCGRGCAAGYACAAINTAAGPITQCVPETGRCGTAPPVDSGLPRDVAPPTDTGPAPDAGPTTLPRGATTVTLGARQAVLYVPAGFRGGGPGLVALHGNGDTAANFLATSGLRGVADSEGVALILPIALRGSGPMGVDWDAYTRPATSNPDIALARAARAHLVAGGADPRRVFLLGYSQGGYLAFHVAMAAATEFGAVNVSGAGDPMPGAMLAAGAARRIPVDLLVGALDGAIANTRRTRDDLLARGFEVRYTELPGVGHCCPVSVTNGRTPTLWSWLAARPLP